MPSPTSGFRIKKCAKHKERFLQYVQKSPSGCWLWTGGKKAAGYGVFSINQRTTQAHRAAYAIFRATVPAGLLVCHTCHVPACVNPEHLYLGTVSDNSYDSIKAGRHGSQLYPEKYAAVARANARNRKPATGKRNGAYTCPESVRRGEDSATAKLTTDQVLEIKNSTEPTTELLKRFPVKRARINQIRRGFGWAHL